MRPENDYPHPVGPEPNFNESMYFHFHDPKAQLGGFLRLANRPNEGRGERTVCIYLPDGRLAFSYARPACVSNDAFDSAGLRFIVLEPFEQHQVAFAGEVAVLDDPAAMDDPKAALGTADTIACDIDLGITATAPAFDHSFDTDEGSFAPNHYEQLLRAQGEVRLGDQAVPINGYGLRDHSWGPRYWQTPWFYRWLHGSGDGFGFMGAWFGRPDGSTVSGGFVYENGALHEVDRVELRTERDDRQEQLGVSLVLGSEDGSWRLRGHAESKVPLRNRRDDGTGRVATTRIVEALMTWTREDGAVVHGMAEYLDQIIDGRPVGLAV